MVCSLPDSYLLLTRFLPGSSSSPLHRHEENKKFVGEKKRNGTNLLGCFRVCFGFCPAFFGELFFEDDLNRLLIILFITNEVVLFRID